MKYAHRNSKFTDLRFQFPKFYLVRYFILATQLCVHSAKWKSYWLIDWHEYYKNTTSFGFQFHSPKLSRKSCFTRSFNYAGLYKKRSMKEATENFQRRVPWWKIEKTKNISFQFRYSKFSQQKHSTRSYYYRCVTRGTKRESYPVLSRKLEKTSLIFWKKWPDCGHLLDKFLIENAFLKFFQEERPEIFTCMARLSCVYRWIDECLSRWPNSKNPSLPWQIPGLFCEIFKNTFFNRAPLVTASS